MSSDSDLDPTILWTRMHAVKRIQSAWRDQSKVNSRDTDWLQKHHPESLRRLVQQYGSEFSNAVKMNSGSATARKRRLSTAGSDEADDENPQKLTRVVATAYSIKLKDRFKDFVDADEDDEEEVTAQELEANEFPIGTWARDPAPQRIVTARLGQDGEIHATIRNYDRGFRLMEPSARHLDVGGESDRTTRMTFDLLNKRCNWGKSLQASGITQDELQFKGWLIQQTLQADPGAAIAWLDAEDLQQNPGLGRVLEFAFRGRDQIHQYIQGKAPTPGVQYMRMQEMYAEITKLAARTRDAVATFAQTANSNAASAHDMKQACDRALVTITSQLQTVLRTSIMMRTTSSAIKLRTYPMLPDQALRLLELNAEVQQVSNKDVQLVWLRGPGDRQAATGPGALGQLPILQGPSQPASQGSSAMKPISSPQPSSLEGPSTPVETDNTEMTSERLRDLQARFPKSATTHWNTGNK